MKFIKLNSVMVGEPVEITYYVNQDTGDDTSGVAGDNNLPFKTIQHVFELIELADIKNKYIIALQSNIVLDETICLQNFVHNTTIEGNGHYIIVGKKITGSVINNNSCMFSTDIYPSSILLNDKVYNVNTGVDLHYPNELMSVVSCEEVIIDGIVCLKLNIGDISGVNFSGSEKLWFCNNWKTGVADIVKEEDGYVFIHKSKDIQNVNNIWKDFIVGSKARIINNEAYGLSGTYYFAKENSNYNVTVSTEDESITSLYVIDADIFLSIERSCNLTIKNVYFAGGKFDEIESTQSSREANGLIEIADSCNIEIYDCSFYGTFDYAIKILDGSCGINISKNLFYKINGGGIYIFNQSSEQQDISIYNNLIKGYGYIDSNGNGILLRAGNGITINHNTICDGFYTAITCGFSWGYAPSKTFHNHITNNHIHHCMLCVTNDGGGIYTLGLQPNSIIEYNKIHDVYGREDIGCGLYADEGTTEMLYRYNSIFSCDRGYFQHYGHRNIIYNSLFAYNLFKAISSAKSTDNNANQVSVLNNFIVEESASVDTGLSIVYVNNATTNINVYSALKNECNSSIELLPSFQNISNGDLSYTDGYGSNRLNTESRFYNSFLNNTNFGILLEEYNSGEVDTWPTGSDILEDNFEYDGVSLDYATYYKHFISDIKNVTNSYLQS